jgi:hypothetical protein
MMRQTPLLLLVLLLLLLLLLPHSAVTAIVTGAYLSAALPWLPFRISSSAHLHRCASFIDLAQQLQQRHRMLCCCQSTMTVHVAVVVLL